MPTASAILETALYAADLDACEVFYREVFGLAVVSKVSGRHVFLRCGAQMLLIFNPDATSQSNGPIPAHGGYGPGHVCFSARDGAELAAWRDHFAGLGVAIEREHVWDGSGARSIYLRDPAGNSVEVAERRLWGEGF